MLSGHFARERHAAIQPIGEIIRENIFEPYRERLIYPAAAAGAVRVLHAFVAQVKARVRSVDLLLRCGGAKFAVLLPDTPQEEAAIIAELLRGDVAHAPLATGHSLTASIGVSELRVGDAVESWVKRADVALSNAKDEGRNRVMVAGGAEKVTSSGMPVTP